jgi:hypothetical protein
MIDHLSIGVRDVARAKRFYDAVLAPLGYKCLSASDGSLGYGDAAAALWVIAAERPVPADDKSGLHVCFKAPTRRDVDAFTRLRSRWAERTMAGPGCAPTMAIPTTRPSWSIQTAIASKPIAAAHSRKRAAKAPLPPRSLGVPRCNLNGKLMTKRRRKGPFTR